MAILHLSGPQGNCDICCIYLDATSSTARRKAMTELAKHLSPNNTTLTILAGGFNFVAESQDRWSVQSGHWAENGDTRGMEVLEAAISILFHVCEWDQPHHTCEVKGARAKLDRIYVNQHVSNQLDMACTSFVGPLQKCLSSHRFVGIARVKSDEHGMHPPLQKLIFEHEHVLHRAHVHF